VFCFNGIAIDNNVILRDAAQMTLRYANVNYNAGIFLNLVW